jgi:hypothetical protein
MYSSEVWTEGNAHVAVENSLREGKRKAKGKIPVWRKHYGFYTGKHLPHKVFVKLYR